MFKYRFLLTILVVLLLAGCSRDDASDSEERQVAEDISFRIDAGWVKEGFSRATTFDNADNATNLQTEGSFKCAAYNGNSLTVYISPVDVDWNGSRWSFSDGSHTWPEGNLDFFAYMPATCPSYIAVDPALTYTAGHNVTFTCSNLPMTNAAQGSTLKEFVYAMALGQNKIDNGAGVSLVFQHPFARIKLQLAASHPDVTINSITLRSIKNSGDFTYNHSASTSTWVPSGEATNFVLSLAGDAAVFNGNPASPTQIGDYYIMIPQNWAGEIIVNADCLFWGEKVNYPSLTTTVPTNWQPGYSYTYTFNISPDDLKVDISKFTEQW